MVGSSKVSFTLYFGRNEGAVRDDDGLNCLRQACHPLPLLDLAALTK
jgi:hypothetical protein